MSIIYNQFNNSITWLHLFQFETIVTPSTKSFYRHFPSSTRPTQPINFLFLLMNLVKNIVCGESIQKRAFRTESNPKYEPIKTPFNERFFLKLQQFRTTLTSDIDWCSQLLTAFCDLDRVVTSAFLDYVSVFSLLARKLHAWQFFLMLECFLQNRYTNCVWGKNKSFL